MPLRRSMKFGKFVAGPDGIVRPVAGNHTVHHVTGEDEVESVSGEIDVAFDCGCFGVQGGYCELCRQLGAGGLCCSNCFHRCSHPACGRGICLDHSIEIEDPPGEIRRLCVVCFLERERAIRRQRILRILFLPITLPFRILIWIFFRAIPESQERLPHKQVLRHPFQPTMPRHQFFNKPLQTPLDQTEDRLKGDEDEARR